MRVGGSESESFSFMVCLCLNWEPQLNQLTKKMSSNGKRGDLVGKKQEGVNNRRQYGVEMTDTSYTCIELLEN